MKKIALIQPKSPNTFMNMSGSFDFTKKKAMIPPLGLATVAALTPSGYEVVIIDEQVEEIDFDINYDLVGITGYTLHSSRMFEISEEFRKRGILTVGGGPFCSGHSEDAKPYFDVLVCGEVENVWGEFLTDWEKNDFKNYYVGEDNLDLSATPAPRWELVDLSVYNLGIVQTSRGCPFDCEFCDVVSLFGRGNRYKPVDNILNEVKYMAERGMGEVFLADDNLIGQRRFIKDILHGLIELNKTLPVPLRFVTQLTLDVSKDLELLDLFKEANFWMFFIGIESPNADTLVLADKGHNLRLEIKESIRRIQSRGIMIYAGMIVGFDSDSPEIFEQQSQFLIDTGITVTTIAMLIAYKGTKLWTRMEQEERLLPYPDKLDMLTYAKQNFVPKNMTPEQLREGYVRLLKNIYSDSHFLKRFQSFIDQVEVDELNQGSHSSKVLAIKNIQWEVLAFAFRVVKYYLFTSSRRRRKLFISAFKIGMKKGGQTIPFIISSLYLFKTSREFVEQRFFDTSATAN